MPSHGACNGRSIAGLKLARRLLQICASTLVVMATTASNAAQAQTSTPAWAQRIDTIVGDDPVSVVIGFQGEELFNHREWVRRPPASNEKLLLSMALLQRFGPDLTIPTRVSTTKAIGADGVLRGDLWIIGRGDPEVDRRDMARLAYALRVEGLRSVRGRVMGAIGPFARDWFAPGWRDYFPTYYIALPTGLTFEANRGPRGRNIRDPERLAATSLTNQLEARGVRVRGKPGYGTAPRQLTPAVTTASEPLGSILHRMNVVSSNFRAEVLGKYLGAHVRGPPGSIAKGARAIERFAAGHAVAVEANDSSGLSYANRISAEGVVRLLWAANAAPWGDELRSSLAAGGQGTLEDRLTDVRIRAKTGTLISVSALSGWVWLERERAWAEFSILSRGISKTRSVRIENAIVRVVSAHAGPT
jgi:D-alanyl-D-alanine carboxypeptidase/D-alanyl-D-alanine-endopeptidase (penicillin-binding protein 4)